MKHNYLSTGYLAVVLVSLAHGQTEPLSKTQVSLAENGWQTAQVPGFGMPINVRLYGAKGDGVANDTAAIQAAINATDLAYGGGHNRVVFFPPGTYVICAPGLIASVNGYGVKLLGSGRWATELKVSVGPSAAGITFANSTPYGNGGGIEDMTVYATSKSKCQDLVDVINFSGWNCRNLNLATAGRHCLYLLGCIHCDIGGTSQFSSAAASGLAITDAGNISTTINVGPGVYLNENVGPGADVRCLQFNGNGIIFESNGNGTNGEGLRFEAGTGVVEGCYFENNAGNDITSGYSSNQSTGSVYLGTSLTVINPFVNDNGRYKRHGYGGFLSMRGNLNYIGPGTWIKGYNWVLQAAKANGAAVTFPDLPASVAVHPTYDDGSALPPYQMNPNGLSSTIYWGSPFNTGSYAKMEGLAPNCSTAVGVILDNFTALTTTGSRIVSIRNAGVEKASIDDVGILTTPGVISPASTPLFVGSSYNRSALSFRDATHICAAVPLVFTAAGSTVIVKTGSDAAAGTVSLSHGSGTITSFAITTKSVIVLSLKVARGANSYPQIAVGNGSATVTGLSTDNGTYNWAMLLTN